MKDDEIGHFQISWQLRNFTTPMAGRKTTNDGGIVGPQIFQVLSLVAWWCDIQRGVLFGQKRKFSAVFLGGIFWVVPNSICSRCHNTHFFEIKEHSQSRNPEGMWFCSMYYMYYTDCLNIRILERLCVVAITSSCFAMWEARQGFAYGTAGFPVCNRSENNTRSLDAWMEVQEFQFLFPTFLCNLFLVSKIFLREKSRRNAEDPNDFLLELVDLPWTQNHRKTTCKRLTKRCDQWLGGRFVEDAEEWQSAVFGGRRGANNTESRYQTVAMKKGYWENEESITLNLYPGTGQLDFSHHACLWFCSRKRKWNGSGVQGRNSTFLAQRGAELSGNFNFCGDCGVWLYPMITDYTPWSGTYIFQIPIYLSFISNRKSFGKAWRAQPWTSPKLGCPRLHLFSTTRNHCNTSLLSQSKVKSVGISGTPNNGTPLW